MFFFDTIDGRYLVYRAAIEIIEYINSLLESGEQ